MCTIDTQPNKQAGTQFVQLRRKQGSHTPRRKGCGGPSPHEEELHGHAGKPSHGEVLPGLCSLWPVSWSLFPHWTALGYQRLRLSVHQCRNNPQDNRGGSRRGQLSYLPGKVRHTRLVPRKSDVFNPRAFNQGFYNCGSKVGSLTRLWGEQGLHSLNLISGDPGSLVVGSPSLDDLLWSL